MTIYYLNGGEDIKKRKSFELNKKIISTSGATPILYVFPWSIQLGSIDTYREITKQYFLDCGAKEVRFADEHKPFEELKKEALQSNAIYLPGGNTSEFMKNAKTYRLKEILEVYDGIIIGNSAGTMILGEQYIGFPEEGIRDEILIGKGLGILPITTVSHYERSQLEEIHKRKLQVQKPIYCIPVNQAIQIEDKIITKLGKDIEIIK